MNIIRHPVHNPKGQISKASMAASFWQKETGSVTPYSVQLHFFPFVTARYLCITLLWSSLSPQKKRGKEKWIEWVTARVLDPMSILYVPSLVIVIKFFFFPGHFDYFFAARWANAEESGWNWFLLSQIHEIRRLLGSLACARGGTLQTSFVKCKNHDPSRVNVGHRPVPLFMVLFFIFLPVVRCWCRRIISAERVGNWNSRKGDLEKKMFAQACVQLSTKAKDSCLSAWRSIFQRASVLHFAGYSASCWKSLCRHWRVSTLIPSNNLFFLLSYHD